MTLSEMKPCPSNPAGARASGAGRSARHGSPARWQVTSPRRLWPGIGVLAWALLASWPACAVKPQNVTEGEIALLPEYCIDTEAFIYGSVGNPGQSPRAPMWVERMGPTFRAMHHYCWGLVNLNRLRAGRIGGDRRYAAKQIVDEYFYVLRLATPDFIMLPELWTRVGEAALIAEDYGQALDAYEKARRIKPDYWPAYTQWADFLIQFGKKNDAKALVRNGLQYAPDAKPLIDLYRKLGGDPSTVPRPAASETPTSEAGPVAAPELSASSPSTAARSTSASASAPASP